MADDDAAVLADGEGFYGTGRFKIFIGNAREVDGVDKITSLNEELAATGVKPHAFRFQFSPQNVHVHLNL